jgi:hypothetical protein
VTGAAGSPSGGDRAIAAYLAEIAACLSGPSRVRRDILAELVAGLAEA